MAAAVEDIQRITRERVARECLEAADGDERAAAALLRERLAREPALAALALEDVADKVASRWLRMVRAPAPRPPECGSGRSGSPESDSGVSGLVFLAKSNAQDLLNDYRLASGVTLAQASRSDLLEEIALRKEAASAHLVHVQFLGRVAQAMGSAGRVSAALSNTQLEQLLRQARADVVSG